MDCYDPRTLRPPETKNQETPQDPPQDLYDGLGFMCTFARRPRTPEEIRAEQFRQQTLKSKIY